jgi:hypothetical protein
MLHPAPQRRVAWRAGVHLVARLARLCAPHGSLIDRKPPALITFTWLLLIALIGGILAVIDGILRLRGKGGTVVGIVELIAGALFLLSLFVPIPFGSMVLAVITAIALIVALIVRGKSGLGLTIAALALIVIWIVLANRWLVIPGIN